MNTDFAANGLDDSIKLIKIRAYCKDVMSISSSGQDCIDTVLDILDVIDGKKETNAN